MGSPIKKNWTVIGVDPAPTKDAVIWKGSDGARPTRFTKKARVLREWVREVLNNSNNTIIAWDAPLSFNPGFSFSDRPVDRAVRRFLK